jgi:hypothetical protein
MRCFRPEAGDWRIERLIAEQDGNSLMPPARIGLIAAVYVPLSIATVLLVLGEIGICPS